MDWSHVAFDWNRARAFLATADEGSFSAAARALSSTQPTVGRQVAALEEELGVALFERVGRGLELTPTGLELVEHVRAMAAAAQRLSRVAAGQSLELDGPIVVSAGEVVATYVLPPILGAVRDAYPGIVVEIVATNQVSDLARREADIALRNVAPADPDLVARKVRDDVGYLYATPAYLTSLGEPTTLQELARGDFIAFDDTDTMRDVLVGMGLPITADHFRWICASQNVQWRLVTQGSGIGVMLAAIGDAEPRVVRVLPEQLRFPVPMWLTSHREVRTSRRVRIVFDLLAEALSNT